MSAANDKNQFSTHYLQVYSAYFSFTTTLTLKVPATKVTKRNNSEMNKKITICRENTHARTIGKEWRARIKWVRIKFSQDYIMTLKGPTHLCPQGALSSIKNNNKITT